MTHALFTITTSIWREKNPRLLNLILEIAISRRKKVIRQHLGVARNLIPQSQCDVRELLITQLSHRQPRKFIGAGILFRARINGSTASINPFLRDRSRVHRHFIGRRFTAHSGLSRPVMTTCAVRLARLKKPSTRRLLRMRDALVNSMF